MANAHVDANPTAANMDAPAPEAEEPTLQTEAEAAAAKVETPSVKVKTEVPKAEVPAKVPGEVPAKVLASPREVMRQLAPDIPSPFSMVANKDDADFPTHNLDMDLPSKAKPDPKVLAGIKPAPTGPQEARNAAVSTLQPMAEPKAGKKAPQMGAEKMTACHGVTCGYTAPFLTNSGGGEPDMVMDTVMDTVRSHPLSGQSMAPLTFEPQGQVPPTHALTMSRGELVIALTGLDYTSVDDTPLDDLSTRDLRDRLVSVLSTETPTPTPIPTFTAVPDTPSTDPSPSPSVTEVLAESASTSYSPSMSISQPPSSTPSVTSEPSASPSMSISGPALLIVPVQQVNDAEVVEENEAFADGAAAGGVVVDRNEVVVAMPPPVVPDVVCDSEGITWAMVLVTMHIIVGLISFVVQMVNPTDADDAGFAEILPYNWATVGDLLDDAFNSKSLSHARQLMQMIPPAATIMVFITFRSCIHGLHPLTDSDYTSVKAGFALFAAGMGLMVLDALGVRVNGIFGNLNQSVGTLAVTVGYIMLIWASVDFRDSGYAWSTAETCFVALSVFLLTCIIFIMIKRMREYMAKSEVKLAGMIPDLINEEKLVEVMSSMSYAPLLMVTYMYVDLHHKDETIPPVTKMVNQSVVGGTVGVYLLGLATLARAGGPASLSRLALIFRVFMLMLVYSSMMLIVYQYADEGPTSLAAVFMLGLVCAISVVKAGMLFIQDATHSYLDDVGGDDEREPSPGRIGKMTDPSHAKPRNLLRLLKDMLAVVGLTTTFIVVLGVLHFKPVVLLEMDPDVWAYSKPSLVDGMKLAVSAVFIQIGSLVAGHVMGKRSFLLSVVQSIGLGLFYVGLLICVDNALYYL